MVAKTGRLYGYSAHSTNGLLHQLKKRGYIEEKRIDSGPSLKDKDPAHKHSYSLTAEFRRFLEEHNLHALIRQHLRPR